VFPTLLAAPVIDVAAAVIPNDATTGQTITCGGTWSVGIPGMNLFRTPASRSYTWQRDGKPIAGATSARFKTTVPGDYRCTETATNGADSASSTSQTKTIRNPKLVKLLSSVTSQQLSHGTRRVTWHLRYMQTGHYRFVLRSRSGTRIPIERGSTVGHYVVGKTTLGPIEQDGKRGRRVSIRVLTSGAGLPPGTTLQVEFRQDHGMRFRQRINGTH
ncbi:MAG: hypothetical protein ACR2JV_03610, partial [Gaiellales bacterium]